MPVKPKISRRPYHNKGLLYRFWKFLLSDTMAFMMGILAIIIGYYQFYISRPILEYSTVTGKLISSSAPDSGLHLHINGTNYQNIYKSTVSLTNNGEEALSGEDVSPLGHDPIRIPIPQNVKILYYGIDYDNTSPEVDAKLLREDKDIVIKFGYLNPGNSIAVNLFSEQDFENYKVVGSAVGVNQITKSLNNHQSRKILVLGIMLILSCYILFTLLYFHKHRRLPRI
ncbi:MAG: hypothetical protein IJ689_00930 [Alphaproteobacteria bacterium]|nr:hypothetical protein [Alphaproteobacteria bacterium]